MRATLRTIALFVGLLGTLIALVVNILYSLTHTLARISGFTDDQSHFFLGLIVVVVAFVGSVLVPRSCS